MFEPTHPCYLTWFFFIYRVFQHYKAIFSRFSIAFNVLYIQKLFLGILNRSHYLTLQFSRNFDLRILLNDENVQTYQSTECFNRIICV